MGNATWGRPKPPPPPDPTPEDHARAIAQARLNRIASPPTTYSLERVKWARNFALPPTPDLQALLPSLTQRVANLNSTVNAPPSWTTLQNWEEAAAKLDEWGAMLDALTQTLTSRLKR
jgi:hypothetical protein